MKRKCVASLYKPLYWRAQALMKLREIETFSDFIAIMIREEWERRETMGNHQVLAMLLSDAKKEPDNPDEGHQPQTGQLNLE
jgi:hypothetical protein